MGHSLDRFQELRMKGKNDKVGLCSFYVIWRNCSLNPPALKTVYVQSPGFKVSNLSQPCVHWWVFVGVKNWTRSCEDAITPLTHRYHKRHLMTESFWRDKLLLTFSEESVLLFLLNIITKRWTVRKRGGGGRVTSKKELCESVFKHYFGTLLRRKQPSCQSGFLHECNPRGQGSGKILTDTRTLMYPRPLKQMTQILSESRHFADSALQM